MPQRVAGRAALSIVAGLAAGLLLQGCGSGFGTSTFNAAASSAQSNQAVSSPPQLGYVWSNTDRSLRAITGIAGSSRVTASVVPNGAYVTGAASAVSATAVMVRTDGFVERLALPTGTVTSFGGITAPANARVRFSPSGTYAVVFVPGSTGATLITKVNTAPQVVALAASSALIDAAVSDKGTVAVLQKQGGGAQLALLDQSAAVRAITALSGPGSLNFVGKQDDLLLADGAANALVVIRNVSTAPAMTQVPTASLLSTPLAVGAALDGRWAVVANGADASVVRVDLTGATPPQKIACPVQPTTVDQLAGNASFRFTDVGKSPAWVADISTQSPSMLFIPAIAGL